MKKTILGVILALVTVFAGAIGLAACNGGGDDEQYIEAQASINLNCDFETSDYISSFRLNFVGCVTSCDGSSVIGGQYELTTWPTQTSKKEDAVLRITLKQGYAPETLGIVEQNGKAFTKSTTTELGKGVVIVTIPFAENIAYDFTFTAPEPIYNNVGFRIEDATVLEQVETGALLDLLSGTQVWVENADGDNPGFVDITKDDEQNPGDKIFTLSSYAIKADLSKSNFPVYVRFDKTNPARVIYNDYYKDLFTFTFVGETAHNVQYTQIPGTDEYAYAFNFSTSSLSNVDTPVLTLYWDRLDEYLGYRESTVNKTFSVTTYKEDNSGLQYNYKFELVSYQVGSGEEQTTIPSTLTKEYGNTLTLKYQFNGIEVKNNSGYIEIDTENRARVLEENTDFAQIKLTVNGEIITGYFDSATKIYTRTIGATKIPYDYNKSSDDSFRFGADVTSFKVVATNKNVITQTVSKGVDNRYYNNTDEKFVFSRYETDTDTVMIVIDENKNTVIGSAIPLADYPKFQLKLTLNGAERFNETFTAGEDFYVPVTDKTGYEAFGNAIAVNNNTEYRYIVGSESTKTYLYIQFSQDYLGINLCDEGNTDTQTDFKVEVTKFENSNQITFEVAGSVYEGSFTLDGEQTTTVSLGKEYAVAIPLSDFSLIENNYYFECYSNGVLIATTANQWNGNSAIDNYMFYMPQYHGGSFSYNGLDGLTFTLNIKSKYCTFTSYGDIGEDKVSTAIIVIDKIVLRIGN